MRKLNKDQLKAKKIIDLLLTTKMTQEEIAKECDCSRTTVRRINIGESHYNKELSYPLRKPVSTISEV